MPTPTTSPTSKRMPFFSGIPASAPVSPVTTRNNSSTRGYSAPPVTPRNIHSHNKYAPLTPLTPYSPLSSHSLSSTNTSALNTPVSVINAQKKLSFSPDVGYNTVVKHGGVLKDKSVADITDNWRSRANENGIRVGGADEGCYAADDEASEHMSDHVEYNNHANEEVLLPPPFLSTHRRRAQSQATPPRTRSSSLSYTQNQFHSADQQNAQFHTPVRQPRLPLSPTTLRTVAGNALNFNTPPPKAPFIRELKAKGSTTDPGIRRRNSFSRTTTDLFDIDENDQSHAPYPEPTTYPQFSPTRAPKLEPFPLSLDTISESFHELSFHENPISFQTILNGEKDFHFDTQNPFINSDHVQANDAPHAPKPNASIDTSTCSVCGLKPSSPSSIAILEPCSHPLCSACLTSALNIVGEKDMECSVCRRGVKDFRLGGVEGGSQLTAKNMKEIPKEKHSSGLLPSALQSGFQPRSASTPVPRLDSPAGFEENIVLRIDNVPWDITPPAITAWLRQPVVNVHVLLDRKGKTLSHAFVELANDDVARAALRGAQNSVLGKGRRARGVTVTRSGQEELLKALFPSWKGNFDGSRPSLAGLDNEHVIATLESGLITEGELTALLHLIRSPDSHFLKVPCLPFYSLVSILAKFPADVDSRVFWSGSLRDLLYDVTYTAVQVLLKRDHAQNVADTEGEKDLLMAVARAGMECQAFTNQQLAKLSALVDISVLRTSTSSPSTSPSSLSASDISSPTHQTGTLDAIGYNQSAENGHDQTHTNGHSSLHDSRFNNNTFHDTGYNHTQENEYNQAHQQLAREFGVEANLVQALMQRLSGM